MTYNVFDGTLNLTQPSTCRSSCQRRIQKLPVEDNKAPVPPPVPESGTLFHT